MHQIKIEKHTVRYWTATLNNGPVNLMDPATVYENGSPPINLTARRAPDHISGKSMSNLNWKLLTKKRASSTRGIPPGREHLAWVTNTVTLIYGQRDAVLVDTFLSDEHSKDLVDWVAESGRNLTTIYITHSHGDHFFGIQRLLDRFPDAKAVATASVVAAIQEQIKPDMVESVWEPRFPGQIPRQLIGPQVLKGDTFYLEGEPLKVLELGHTDASHSTGLCVPALGLVVSGDAVYNNTHPYLAERDESARSERGRR
jgi:glyoxylase-like metal-dependent hydrolase (beta-lactamase superfamily II)